MGDGACWIYKKRPLLMGWMGDGLVSINEGVEIGCSVSVVPSDDPDRALF